MGETRDPAGPPLPTGGMPGSQLGAASDGMACADHAEGCVSWKQALRMNPPLVTKEASSCLPINRPNPNSGSSMDPRMGDLDQLLIHLSLSVPICQMDMVIIITPLHRTVVRVEWVL